MLKSINQAGSVCVVPQPQNEGQVQQNQQAPHMGNVNFERNPKTDNFQKQNDPGASTTTKALGVIGMLALFFAGVSLHKGSRILQGKNASILEKLKIGSKEFLNKAKKIFSPKSSKTMGDFEEILGESEKKSHDAFSERLGARNSASESKLFDRLGIRRNQPKPKSKTGVMQDVQRESTIDKLGELFGAKSTRMQQLEINNINRNAQETFAKSRQIGESIPKDVAKRLRNIHPVTLPGKTVPKVRQTAVISKSINEVKVKRPVGLKSKISGSVAVPKKATQKSLMRSNTQMKIIAQANPKAAGEIKSLEGNIKRIQKKIDGAKKFGQNKNISVLERNLETNKKKLEKLKSETLNSIETVAQNKKSKGSSSDIMQPKFLREKEEKRAVKVCSESKQSGVKKEQTKAKTEAAKRGTSAKPAATIQELARTPFNKISGVKEGAGLVKQYDSKGNLLRSVRDKGSGLIEVTEYNGHNANGISYYMRDGMIIRKSDIGKQSENMRRLVHNLKGVNDKDEIKRIVGSYADRYGMKEVNDTIMIGGKQAKVIYRGFDCDITADGRVISRKYAADGTCTLNIDITEQLSQKTSGKANTHNHKKQRQIV